MPSERTRGTTVDANTTTLIRPKELARRLGVNPSTIFRMRHELPPQVRLTAGVHGWLLSDIEAWLAARKSPTTPPTFP